MKTSHEAKKMTKGLVLLGIIPFAFSVFFTPSVVFCLEKMDKKQLKAETGQAGLDIGMDSVVIYHGRDSLRIANPKDPENNYVGFENIKALGVFETGAKDLDNDGVAGKLTVDIGAVTNNPDIITDDIPLVFLSCPDWMQNIDVLVGNINWCGKNIGSAEIRGFSLPSWHAYIGSYAGAGIDFQLGFRTKIEEIKFNYGEAAESFSVQKLQAAGTFTGAPEDPSAWVASGEFKVGDALASTPNPATIDIGVRENTDGTATPIIQMQLNASGSIRASDLKFGTQSFGPMALDGIKVHSMKIEAPGRGLGGN